MGNSGVAWKTCPHTFSIYIELMQMDSTFRENSNFSATSTALLVSTAAATSGVLGYYLGRWSLSSERASSKKIQVQKVTLEGSETGDLCMYIIVLEEIGNQSLSQLVDTSCRILLGQYKKLYRRNNPILQEWDRIQGKKKTRLFAVPSPSLLADVHASARASMVPTHTFVTIDKEQNKHRRAVVVGPTTDDLFHSGILNSDFKEM